MAFLAEHQSIDVHHNRLMQDYAASMLRKPSDIAEVIDCMEVTGELYARMIEGTFANADEEHRAPARVLAA
jgi:purine nucleoside phosphorylase